jgi:hypothetical protein
VFAGRDAAIAMQEPCWTDAHSQGDPLEYYNLNGVTWLENALELLDAPGEWYLDRSAGFAYYRPRDGEDLATAPVVAATLEGLIDGRGEVTAGGTRWLHNIRFEGLTFAYAGWLAPSSPAGYPEIQAGWHASLGNKADSIRTPGAVAFTAARAIGFERNAFTHLGAVGLDLATVQSCTVIGNAFRDISSTAIQLGEVSQAIRTATDPDAQTADNAIADNLIADAAAEYHGAVGIFVGYSRGTTIAHNDVGELPYTGISIGWGWGLAPDGTLTGCHDSFAGGIRLTGNAVHDVLRSLNDGGGIYTLGGAPDSVLEGNAISSVGHPGIGFASGIYHDQGTCYYTDRSNVVSGAPLWLAMWQPGTIVNNVIHDNYVDIDAANCWGIYGTSDHCNLGDPAGDHNTAFGNTATGGAWPAAAEAIRDQAGLEPAYRDLAAPGSGQRQDPR